MYSKLAPKRGLSNPSQLPRYTIETVEPGFVADGNNKADWADQNTEIFLKICEEEIESGNKPTKHLNKTGYTNLVSKFNERTGLSLNQKQFKNKWDSMRKYFALWAQFIGNNETGLGWDYNKMTMQADNSWWEDKIKENPEYAKFRLRGPKNLDLLENIFIGSIATDYAAIAPSEDQPIHNNFNDDTNDWDVQLDGEFQSDVYINVESQEFMENSTMGADNSMQQRKRKRRESGEKRGHIATRLADQLDRVLQEFETQKSIHETPKDDPCSIENCLEVLRSLPGMVVGSEQFFIVTRVLGKKHNRQTFIGLKDSELQLGWAKTFTKDDLKRY
ncbi:L10-interacting MYB domain-containing protein-like [Primulina tabacum]|uniref:L10-interacting MYB domain-containing protein-like n=1 Tax=Primulina tabacum TaxID=48773 RepID=UPI003F592178